MSAAAISVPIISGTTDRLSEALRLIRTVHRDADERSVKICEAADDVPDGPRLAANMMISSLGVGAVLSCTSEGVVAGSKRAAPTTRVHYAYYATPR